MSLGLLKGYIIIYFLTAGPYMSNDLMLLFPPLFQNGDLLRNEQDR